MKKGLMIGACALALFVTGCSQKAPEVDMTKETPKTDSAPAVSSGGAVDAGPDVASIIAGIEASLKKVYFDFDKFNVRADQKGNVEQDATVLNDQKAKQFSIKVEGNCDEWGTDEYNYALGLKRAKSVKDSLVSLGVKEDRMMMVSYGESNPVCQEKNKDCWQQNRRVEFKVLP